MKNVHFHSPEEALETLRLATEAAHLGIWDLNVQTGELHWSEHAKAAFGVTGSGPFQLSDFHDRVHPEEKQRVTEAVTAACDPAKEGPYDLEFRICRPNNETRHVHAKGRAFFEERDGVRTATRFVGTLLDQTEQKLAQAALAQAEQLAATGRLAASIAHEINNPLESVTNLLFLLRSEPLSEGGQQYLHLAESELARVSEIASNTLRFYRDPKGITDVDVPGLTHSVIGLFQGRMAVRGVELDYRCTQPMNIAAMQGELRQVLVNLIGNALDAMPSGGRLRVRCREFRNHLGRQEAGVGLCIADTGTGMSGDVLKRAFDPFFTTKGSSGTGLGLWLSLGILKRHGFRVQVKSKLGKGSVFSLFMPVKA